MALVLTLTSHLLAICLVGLPIPIKILGGSSDVPLDILVSQGQRWYLLIRGQSLSSLRWRHGADVGCDV